MHEEFGASRLEPVAFFESHRDVIEAAASHTFADLASPKDRMQMYASDFETKASRSHRTEADMP